MMTRDLKLLCLALVAVLAMSAVAVPAAGAQGKITSDGPLTLKGEDEPGAGLNFFKYPGLTAVECPGSTYTGHKYKVTPHETIPVNSTTVTIKLHINNLTCNAGGLKATVITTGCDLVLHLSSTTPTTDQYGSVATVVCEPNPIVVHQYASASSEAVTLCTITIGSQEGITGFDLTNESDGSGKTTDTIRMTGTSKNIKASKSGLCGAGSTEAAEYKATITFRGYNAAGAETGVTITD